MYTRPTEKTNARSALLPLSHGGGMAGPGSTQPRFVQPCVLQGDGTVLSLAHAAMAEWALAETGQAVVDCGGWFDAYLLVLQARRRGVAPVAPAQVLGRVQVCRAFTAYQVIGALLRLRRRFSPAYRVGLLNPLHPLLDGDLPEADRKWLFGRLLNALDWFSQAGYPVWMCQQAPSGTAGAALPEAAVFQKELARRYRSVVVSQGRIMESEHGQEHFSLFPGDRPGGNRLRGLSTRVAPGGAGGFRYAV